MATTTTFMTADEYLHLPDSGQPTELVRGDVLTMNPPASRHGQICSQVVYVLRQFLEQNDLGHVLSNDSGVITERNPDTVRGADVAFYSYQKVPRGPLPPGYLPVPPDLVIEVLSPSERRTAVLAKVAEYLEAGVQVVCVLDDEPQRADLYYADKPFDTLNADDQLAIPDVLGDFQVLVGKFFE